MQSESDLLAPVLGYPRLLLTRGEGCYVWDDAGTRYLDFTSGLGVLALGHADPELHQALSTQFATLGHVSNLFVTKPQLDLAAALKQRSFASRVWFANSGTEANEAALKFARALGQLRGSKKKSAIIAFKAGFHGRTMGALSATHHLAYRQPFAPLVPGVRFATFNDLASVDAVLKDDVCAIIVEPVQGEGGVVPATQEFLQGLRERCTAIGASLIFDEVQCGLGRTGHLFAYQSYNVTPDIVTLAKPLAAGLPLGAVLINDDVAAALKPGHHGSTFAGGPAVSAVALKLLERVDTPVFLARVQQAAQRLNDGLQQLAQKSPLVRQVRGVGLMQALVLKSPKKVPPATVVSLARQKGLLVTRAGDDAVRLLPPLNVSNAQIDNSLAILAEVLAELRPKKSNSASQLGAGVQ